MKSRWIEYQGQRIFFCDFANMTASELQREMDETDEVICREPEYSILALTDVSGIAGNAEIIEMFKRSTARTYRYVKKSAALGIGFDGPRKILFDIFMRFSGQDVTLFDDETEAKNWLIS